MTSGETTEDLCEDVVYFKLDRQELVGEWLAISDIAKPKRLGLR